MGDNIGGFETPAQVQWRRRLRAGEAIWLYRHPGAYVAASITGLLAIGFAYPLLGMALLWVSGRASVISGRVGGVAGFSVWLFVLAFVSFMAVMMWRLLLLARVRLAERHLDYPDW